jgi:phosphatidate cytidylyltransferase
MLKQRVITALIALPILIAAIWFGTPWFTILMAAITLVGIIEFYRMATSANIQPLTYFGIACAVLLASIPHCQYIGAAPFLLTLAIIISLIWSLSQLPRERAFHNWTWTMAGILYIGWMLSYWVCLRLLENGLEWVFFAALTTVASDTSAFFIGRAWGKRRIAPTISPNKTWEGALAGFLGAIAAALILKAIFSLPPFFLPINYWQATLLGAGVSIFAQLGDLVESLLKRNTGNKDSGNLLPGHGGILDRVDGFLFSGVMVYYFVILTDIIIKIP